MSDSNVGSGLPPGQYGLPRGWGEVLVKGSNEGIRLIDRDMMLAGSALTPIDVFRNVMRVFGKDMATASQVCSRNPARLMGLNTGEVAVGRDADLIATTFYAPLIEDVKRRGLIALKERFEGIYLVEGGKIEIDCSPDEMLARVAASPAVIHMRRHGYPVARLFVETVRAVNEAICEGAPFAFELLAYDDETGRSVQRFYRRGHNDSLH